MPINISLLKTCSINSMLHGASGGVCCLHVWTRVEGEIDIFRPSGFSFLKYIFFLLIIKTNSQMLVRNSNHPFQISYINYVYISDVKSFAPHLQIEGIIYATSTGWNNSVVVLNQNWILGWHVRVQIGLAWKKKQN